MNKIPGLVLSAVWLLCFFTVSGQEYEYPFRFFTNSLMPGDYFYSRAGATGEASVKSIRGRLPVCDSISHSPGNCLLLEYRNAADGSWKAEIFHQEIRGMEVFKRPSLLVFWVYPGAVKIAEQELPLLQLMRRDSSLTATFRIPKPYSIKPGRWNRVAVPVRNIPGYDPSKPESMIALVLSGQPGSGPQQHTLWIDDIEFLPETPENPVAEVPEIRSAKGYAMHVDLQWSQLLDRDIHLIKIYRSEDGKNFRGVGVQQPFTTRYADFTGKTGKEYTYRISAVGSDFKESQLSDPVRASTRPMTDEELLSMVQEACFRYYWEGAEPYSGLARENVPGLHNMVATGASGFGIMALLVGTERKFITREESIQRFLTILGFLDKAESFHGVFAHFMDGISGKAVPFFGKRDNGADLVETSFLFEGLLAARQYFSDDNPYEKRIRDKITALWERAEWDWFRRYPDGPYLYWHWSPDQAWVIDHRLIGWNETMVTYLLSIASPTHPVPATMYYTGWASQDSIARRYRSDWGASADGTMYTNGNTYFGIRLDVGVNNGGPLFFTHYSYMGYDPHKISDKYTNYFQNNQNIAMINYRYCVSNPKHFKGYGEDGWGLTASDGPFDYSADEPVDWQDNGKLTPTGALASFPYTPAESMKALKNYYFNCGQFLWGEYGFRDSYSLSENWCSSIFMGLNQAPVTVMIENYRTGLIWNLFMPNKEIRDGLIKLEQATISATK